LLVKRENRIDLQWLESCKNQTTNEYSGEKEAELIGGMAAAGCRRGYLHFLPLFSHCYTRYTRMASI